MRRKFWVWLKYTPVLYNFVKEILSHAGWQKNKIRKKQKQTNWQTRLNLHVPKINERGEGNVLLVFIIRFYLQTTIYIRIAKFNGRYLFHMISRSLIISGFFHIKLNSHAFLSFIFSSVEHSSVAECRETYNYTYINK